MHRVSYLRDDFVEKSIEDDSVSHRDVGFVVSVYVGELAHDVASEFGDLVEHVRENLLVDYCGSFLFHQT